MLANIILQNVVDLRLVKNDALHIAGARAGCFLLKLPHARIVKPTECVMAVVQLFGDVANWLQRAFWSSGPRQSELWIFQQLRSSERQECGDLGFRCVQQLRSELRWLADGELL